MRGSNKRHISSVDGAVVGAVFDAEAAAEITMVACRCYDYHHEEAKYCVAEAIRH